MTQTELQIVVSEYMDRFFRDGMIIDKIEVSKDVVASGEDGGWETHRFAESGTITVKYAKRAEVNK